MKMKNWKKLMVFILAIAMVTCSMPFAAWAAAPTIKPGEEIDWSRSLDEREIEDYLKPESRPMDATPDVITLTQGGAALTPDGAYELSLNGDDWEMAKEGTAEDRLSACIIVSASSTAETSHASKAFDGKWDSAADAWVAGAPGEQSITIDFPTAIDVNRLKVISGDAINAAFKVEGSADNADWQPVWETAENTEQEAVLDLDTAVSYRYFRLTVSAGATETVEVREFQLFNVTEGFVNLLQGKEVQASSTFASYYASKAVDGNWANESNGWISGPATPGDPMVDQWLTVNLGEKQTIEGFKVYNCGVASVYGGSETAPVEHAFNTEDFHVDISDDGETWTPVWTVEDNTKGICSIMLSEPVQAAYVRLYITSPSQGGSNPNVRLVEFFALQYQANVENLSEHDGSKHWVDSIPAAVPASIHTNLANAGVIGDPYVGLNDVEARKASYTGWWMYKQFTYEGAGTNVSLNFDGVCDRVDVYLNGTKLGFHQGMFGGPSFDVTDTIRQGVNELALYLYPAVALWQQTVVFDCSYGWHYVDMPPLGVWRDVTVNDVSTVEFDSPFIAAKDAQAGLMDLRVDWKADGAVQGTLKGVIAPKNFTGESYSFSYPVDGTDAEDAMTRLQFNIPNPRLWWPNGIGDQNLYTLQLVLEDESGNVVDYYESPFGIKTIEMGPTPEGEHADKYNWTFIINGRETFMKGSNWCTTDVMMRFTEERYDRFLSLAHNQGIQLLRSWGGGMPETDTFYNLCDKYGICVLQEWPINWDSYETQPENVLYEMVELNVKRIRNHPSLTMWGGGNEQDAPLGLGDSVEKPSRDPRVLNNIGKMVFELDGTRPWHRTDPYGTDSSHDYSVYWHFASLNYSLKLSDTFIGEFGSASYPNYESIAKYAPEEVDSWPVETGSAIAHHTPCFGKGLGNVTPDMEHLEHYANMFYGDLDNVADLATGSQLAQGFNVRHTVQLARTLWPETTGICYYKMTDVYPGASWATADWYGVPKVSYYMIQDAYENLTSVAIFDNFAPYGNEFSYDVWLLDDADDLAGADWKVNTRVYDDVLQLVKEETFEGSDSINRNDKVGTVTLTAVESRSIPLFIVTEVEKDGVLQGRNYYYVNFINEPGCLFDLPNTSLETTLEGNVYTIKNTGNVPAVGVNFDCRKVSDTFTPSDSYFWLEPGETKTVAVDSAEGVDGVTGWNIADVEDSVAPDVPENLTAVSTTSSSVDLSWDAAEDEGTDVYGYVIYRDGQKIHLVKGATSFVDTDLTGGQTYSYQVRAMDKANNYSDPSAAVPVQVLPDLLKPKAVCATLVDSTTITIAFSRVLEEESAETIANYALSGGVTIESATLAPTGWLVTLKTSQINPAQDYTVSLSNIRANTFNENVIIDTEIALEKDLIAYWQLNEGKGEVFYDSTGINQVGVAGGAIWEDGVLGNSLYFTGGEPTLTVGEQTAVVSDTDLNLSDGFTISVWVKPENLRQTYQVIYARGEKTTGHLELYAYGNTLVQLYSWELGTLNAGISLQEGVWQNITVTMGDGLVKFYLNGKKTAQYSVDSKVLHAQGDFSIGSLLNKSMEFCGNIDELKIYARALSDTEVAELGTINIPVESVTLNKTELVLKQQGSEQLFATVMPEDASNTNVTWASDNDAVATVQQNGLVEAHSLGNATITVTTEDGSLTASCEVTVVDVIADYINVNQENTIIDADDTGFIVRTLNIAEGASVILKNGVFVIDNITGDTSAITLEDANLFTEVELENYVVLDLGEKLSEDNTRYVQSNGLTYSVNEKDNKLGLIFDEETIVTVTEKNGDTLVSVTYYCINDGTATKIDTFDNALTAKPGNQIRTDEYTGIRFRAGITHNARKNTETYKVVEYGFIVAREDQLKESGAQLNFDFSSIVSGAAYIMNDSGVVTKDLIYDNLDDEIIFTGVLSNVKPKYYKTVLSARPYMKIKTSNGVHIVYGDITSRSIYQVARAILADENNGLSDAEIAVIKEIIEKANLENEVFIDIGDLY